MQTKESKTNWHFRISIIKSILRIGCGIAIWEYSLGTAAILLIGAEILGILEEI